MQVPDQGDETGAKTISSEDREEIITREPIEGMLKVKRKHAHRCVRPFGKAMVSRTVVTASKMVLPGTPHYCVLLNCFSKTGRRRCAMMRVTVL
jgi:hypothetical protein